MVLARGGMNGAEALRAPGAAKWPLAAKWKMALTAVGFDQAEVGHSSSRTRSHFWQLYL